MFETTYQINKNNKSEKVLFNVYYSFPTYS